MPRPHTVLTSALLVPLLASLVSCGAQDPSDDLLDALRTVCGSAAEISPGDPGDVEPPEYSTREDEWADGRLSQATCVDTRTAGADYDRDPTADMEDLQETYRSADGTSITWAVRRRADDDWLVVWDEGGAPGALDPLADDGFEVVDGAKT